MTREDTITNSSFETRALHVGQEQPEPVTGARAVPIYQTTSYVFDSSEHAEARFALRDSGNVYGRLTNPTQEVLEKRIASLEGGTSALAVASGAAAITYTIGALTKAGDEIVAQSSIYGGTVNLLEHTLSKYGITTKFVDIHDEKALEKAIFAGTKAVLVETFGNPNSDVVDIDAVARIAHAHGVPLIVDNTFASPYLFRPIEHGADIVVHSATKFLGGHGTTLGGVIVEGGEFNWDTPKYKHLSEPDPSYHGVVFAGLGGAAVTSYIRAVLLRDTGAAISPFNAWLLLQGTETLAVRLDRHVENTKKVVEYLDAHPLVRKLNHPLATGSPYKELFEENFGRGGATIFTFDIDGGREEAFAFIDALEVFSLLANVADVKSLVIHPATTTHSELTRAQLESIGITDSTVRLSIGIEEADDIIGDLERGFDAVRRLKEEQRQ